MLKDTLLKLGLTPNECRVYLFLLESGKSKAGEVIFTIKLHRNLVYTALQSLSEKQLVTKTIINGVAEFSANQPEILLENIKEQEKLAEQAIAEMKNLKKEQNRDIQIFEGEEGIMRSRNRVLNYPAGSEFFVLGATNITNVPKLETYWKKFHKEREKKQISEKILFEMTDDPATQEAVRWRNKLDGAEAKFLPFNIDSPFWVDFIEDSLTIGFAGQNPLTINIHSREIVEGFTKYFNYFWNQKVVVKTGLSAVEEAIYTQLNALEKGEEYRVLGALGQDYPEGFNELYDKFHTDRIKKGVVTKMICYQESYAGLKERFEKCGDKDLKISLLKKYVSATPIPMQINLYKGKAFFIIYEKTPTVVYFDSSAIFDTFDNYFENIWNQDTYIIKGPIAFRDMWLEAIETKSIQMIGAKGYFVDQYPELYKEIEKKAKETPGLEYRYIVDRSTHGHKFTQYPWVKIKYSLSPIKNPNVIWIFGNKVAIANRSEKEPVVFISENKHFVQSHRDYFEELWKQ